MAAPGTHRPHPAPAREPGEGAVRGDAALAEAVEVYHRTYTTLLRSSGDTRLRVLEASHRAMGSSLHPLAGSAEPDLGAFLYATRRLPAAIARTELVVMGQSAEVFARHGLPLDSAHLHPTAAAATAHPMAPGETGSAESSAPRWVAVDAPGRRRRWYTDDATTLAVLIASASDVDDLVPTLVAFQIEWNKLHERIRAAGEATPTSLPTTPEACASLAGGTGEDWAQLLEVWGEQAQCLIERIAAAPMSLRVRMLGGTQVGYARVTRRWWQPVVELLEREGVTRRPVYFVSSNGHSIVNLATGTVQERADRIVARVERAGPDDLREELRRFREGRAAGDWSNFLYYAARLFFRELGAGSDEHRRRTAEENALGVFHVGSATALDVAAQVLVLDRLDHTRLDPRLLPVDAEALGRSPAIVVNIDYPLGLAAYNILLEVAETVGELRGVYVLGKAATLNADVGDVMISDVVHDEHSGSTFFLDNAFGVGDIAPFLRFGSGLDNQRAVTVKGTFLQNRGYLDFYYREAYTVVEMEAGPYCQAVYEMSTAARYPVGEPVNFSKLAIDVGIIHYASDTPFTQARTLGARGLSYHGMDSTYASSVAILRRILALEGALTGPLRPGIPSQ